jgi:hypothetical protein
LEYQAGGAAVDRFRRYFKEESQSPSSDEVARLARSVYQDDIKKGKEVTVEFFSGRRLSRPL